MDQPVTPLRAVETELKFALASRFAAAVLQHPAVERAASEPPARARLVSVYYDTPKFDLHAGGAALRLRQTPEGWVQTLKWGGSALGGLHQRAEVESPVSAQELDLEALAGTELGAMFALARVHRRLKPRFVTDFERTNRVLQIGESRIALSFDHGQVVAGKTREPISELELELIAGDMAALFDIAGELQQRLPLRPMSRSKAQRGYALCGLAEPPRKAEPVLLDAQMSIGDSLGILLGSGLSQLQSNEQGMLAGEDKEYLHQMRVAVRRLRSALSAYADVASGEPFEMLRRELKWAGSRLGVARDWDVFATELLPPLLAERRNDPHLTMLERAATEARERSNRSARAAVRSMRYARLIFALGRFATLANDTVADSPLRQPVVPFARDLLDGRHEKVVKRGGKLRQRALAELHALRIAIKRLRYATEFFGALFSPDGSKTYRSRVAELQENLGLINDQAGMLALAQAVMTRKAPALDALISGWNAAVIHAERARLDVSWRQFRSCRKFW